jgi:hypothetical protein
MRWKSMLITIVLNIFLMLSCTLLLEYLNLSERFISIEDSVQEALDSAISASTGSEEFFTESYQNAYVSSVATTENKTLTAAKTLVFMRDTKKFVSLNTYMLAYFYNDSSNNPTSRLPISTDLGTIQNYGSSGVGASYGKAAFIFEWLYGGVGSDYNDSSLSWANRNRTRQSQYGSINSRPSTVNENFRAFYNVVGNQQKSAAYLKVQESGSSFELKAVQYPILNAMGLKFMGGFTSVSSSTTHDNFTSSIKVGKRLNSTSKTYYYLTPASLGVTYVPTEVLKPFLANLDTIVRLNYVGGSTINGQSGDNLADASNCVVTNVYKNGGSVPEAHDGNNGYNIVTDGLVEYDLSSVKVKVDYFYVNFENNTSQNQTIIAKINGAVQSYNSLGQAENNESTARSNTLSKFISSSNDTSNYTANFGAESVNSALNGIRHGRIVARVSVKIKCYVPYQSALMQWMCERFDRNNKHYCIKMYDYNTGEAVRDEDGIWYQYTTFYCTSRS